MKLIQLSLAVLATFTLTFTTSATALEEQCVSIDDATVVSLFNRWNDSLKTLESQKVTDNYANDAVLLPTISNEPRTNRAEIKDYFNTLLKLEPTSVINKRIIKIGCNIAQDVGTYTFTFKGGRKVAARYTFVYEHTDGKWLIEHHHSSFICNARKSKCA